VQTTTPRLTKGRKQAAIPFSPTAAKLIGQIQAEARQKLLDDLSAKDAIIVLHGFDASSKYVYASGNVLQVRDDNGNCISMRRRHVIPESWVGDATMEKHWAPFRWSGEEVQMDAAGRKWVRDIGIHVCDDFGNLVQVAV
jgi:hypothetical protein